MASLTIRKLSDDTKERLRTRAERSGCSLEALARAILDQAALESIGESSKGFPHDLIAGIEPGEDIEPLIHERDDEQQPVSL